MLLAVRNPAITMMIGMGADGIGNTLVAEDAGTCYGYPIPPSNRQGGTKPHPWPRFDGCRRHRRITVAGRVSTLAIKGRRGERQRQGAKSRDVNYSRRMPISPAEARFTGEQRDGQAGSFPRYFTPNPPMDGARTAEGGKGVTGAMIRARIRVDGRLAGGLQALLGAPMAACSGCGERDGRIGHGKRRSRTGMARVGGDVQLAG